MNNEDVQVPKGFSALRHDTSYPELSGGPREGITVPQPWRDSKVPYAVPGSVSPRRVPVPASLARTGWRGPAGAARAPKPRRRLLPAVSWQAQNERQSPAVVGLLSNLTHTGKRSKSRWQEVPEVGFRVEGRGGGDRKGERRDFRTSAQSSPLRCPRALCGLGRESAVALAS